MQSESREAQPSSHMHVGAPQSATGVASGSVNSGISTLKTRYILSRQIAEHRDGDPFRDQLTGYKRLRCQHQKIAKQVPFPPSSSFLIIP